MIVIGDVVVREARVGAASGMIYVSSLPYVYSVILQCYDNAASSLSVFILRS